MHVGLFAFIVIGVVFFTILFAYLFVNHYSSRSGRNWATVVFTTLAIAATLLALLLVSADVYSVSSGLTSTGAQVNPSDTKRAGDALKAFYYSFYFAITLLAFLILPFLYFYYEERSEDDSAPRNLWRALRYTLVFLIVFGVLIGIAFLIKKRHIGGGDDNESWRERIAKDFSNLDQLLTFTTSCLAFLGLILYCYYAGYGLAMVPFALMRSQVVSHDNEYQILLERRNELQSQYEQQNEELRYTQLASSSSAAAHASANSTLEARASVRAAMANDVEARLAQYRARKAGMQDPNARQLESDRLKTERELKEASERLNRIQAIQAQPQRCRRCLTFISWPLGIIALMLSLLIVIQICISMADRFAHAKCCDYTLSKPHYPNPIDRFLLILAKASPVDSIFYTVFIVYLFICAIAGLVALGARFTFFKLYDIRPSNTPANGFIMACMLIMFMGLVLNLQTQSIAPQYTTFGRQFYLADPGPNPNPPDEVTGLASTTYSRLLGLTQTPLEALREGTGLVEDALADEPVRKDCDIQHANLGDTCRLTQIALFIQKNNNQLPFFAGAQFFANIALLAVYLISLIYGFCRSRESWHDPATQTDDPDAPNYVSAQRRR